MLAYAIYSAIVRSADAVQIAHRICYTDPSSQHCYTGINDVIFGPKFLVSLLPSLLLPIPGRVCLDRVGRGSERQNAKRRTTSPSLGPTIGVYGGRFQ